MVGYGGILCLDAAAASPYINIDCHYYDALFLSPHKLLGGVGSCGLLVIKKELCREIKPTFAGGGTVGYVSRTTHNFLSDIEQIEERLVLMIKEWKRGPEDHEPRPVEIPWMASCCPDGEGMQG